MYGVDENLNHYQSSDLQELFHLIDFPIYHMKILKARQFYLIQEDHCQRVLHIQIKLELSIPLSSREVKVPLLVQPRPIHAQNSSEFINAHTTLRMLSAPPQNVINAQNVISAQNLSAPPHVISATPEWDHDLSGTAAKITLRLFNSRAFLDLIK